MLLADLFFSLIGRVVLFFIHRDVKVMRQVRDEKYAGYYSAAGRVYFLNTVAALGAISLTIILIVNDRKNDR